MGRKLGGKGGKMEIVESILMNNPCYKAGRKIAVKGLMLHSVGCPQPSAEAFVKKWNSPEAARACVHAFIDGYTGKVYQTLPWDHRAWHGGGSSNNTHIGVEMCEPSCIKYTGGATFKCMDKSAALEVVKRTYDTAVELFAFLCKKFQLDPMADGVIVSHNEGHIRGIASGHSDPEHLWKGVDSGYTMETFRADVENCMKQGVVESACAPRLNEKAVSQMAQKLNEEAVSHMASEPQEEMAIICPGTIVTLTEDAVYYNGRVMPPWVKADRWIVKSVNGDRVIIDINERGNRAICSPVNIKYVKTVTEQEKEAILSPALAHKQLMTPPPISTCSKMQVSEKGVNLVAKYEGCCLEAYKCPAGVWTIGYGHTQGVQEGQKLASKEEAKTMLKTDLQKYGDYVNEYVQKGIIKFQLNQNQFDALTSFCYNCGKGSLKSLVSDRDAITVADKLLLYNKGGGKVQPGLVRRRSEERSLFLS